MATILHSTRLGQLNTTLTTWCEEPTHWKRHWCWERWKAGEGGSRGWIASPTQWTWVWANSRSWWRTGKPGMLQSVMLQMLDTTERLNNRSLNVTNGCLWFILYERQARVRVDIPSWGKVQLSLMHLPSLPCGSSVQGHFSCYKPVHYIQP